LLPLQKWNAYADEQIKSEVGAHPGGAGRNPAATSRKIAQIHIPQQIKAFNAKSYP